MSRKVLAVLAVIILVVIVLFATGFWSINQTREGALPDVKVSAQGGQLPGFDAQSKEVVVGTTPTTVDVPKVETQKTTVDVPVIGVKDNGNK